MVISSNGLFHFTRTPENLINILTNEFRPRYCLENYANLFHESEGEFKIAIPMTCFCDLPLSQLQEHLNFYGNYGIGLTKEWGLRQRLNPVFYMQPNSNISKYFASLFMYTSSENNFSATASVFNLMHHIKLYEGYAIKDHKMVYKRFYDEKEWRWAPFVAGIEGIDKISLTEEEFNDPIRRSQMDLMISKVAKLSFDPQDISYIIVSSENEILPIIQAIEKIKFKYDQNTVKILTTKIITSERIKQDF